MNANKFFNRGTEAEQAAFKSRLAALQFNVEVAVKNNLPINVAEVRTELVSLLRLDAGGEVDLNITDTSMLFQPRELVETLTKTPYLSLVDVLIYIPRGMKGTMKETAIGLLTVTDLMKDIDKDVLVPLVEYIAMLIEKPQELERTFNLKRNIDGEKVAAILHGLYEYKSEKAQAKYGDVITRNLDWSDVASLNKEVQEVFTEERLSLVIKRHSRIRELAKLLNDVLERAQADLQGSAKTIDALIKHTEYAANVLALYGRIHGHTVAFNVALNDNLERMKHITD